MNYEWNGKQYGIGYFFINPVAYAVAVETASGGIDYVTEPWDGGGRSLVCFLSIVDAHIEGMLRTKPGLRYYVALLHKSSARTK
ncbi:hypothetical protein [Burkholderia sp. LMG 32019]|uniref:hypothetical protein n=1 Tax=Burkholderia sp. LMG 32019 TaxID=3158173 RepID=UPI003C2E361E